MKTPKYILAFVIGWILVDSCRTDQSADTATTDSLVTRQPAPTSPSFLVGLTDLCEQSQQAYMIPVKGLPAPATIPGLDKVTDTTAFLRSYLQTKANELSWLTFIALNWPATPNGTPDSTTCFGSRDGITVWEHWMPGKELFRTDNRVPKPWQYGLTAKGHPINSKEAPELHITKLNELSQFNPERHVLPDQYGNSTLYEVFYNRFMYNYIVGGKLYNPLGQEEFIKKRPRQPIGLTLIQNQKDTIYPEDLGRAFLPIGSAKDTTFDAGLGATLSYYQNVGSIMVKSAWTVLTANEDRSKYHTRTIKRDGNQVVLGLVALHFAHKLAEAPRWMWSTFEHVSNTPLVDKHGKAFLKPGVDYLYFDESQNDPSTYNKPPARERPGKLTGQQPVQIVRVEKPSSEIDQMNHQFRTLIAKANTKSVWLNYRLVGTQWPFSDPIPFNIKGPIEPALLANAVMETYHQGTSSCMGCHVKARFLGDTVTGKFADFVWGLSLGLSPKQKKTTKPPRTL